MRMRFHGEAQHAGNRDIGMADAFAEQIGRVRRGAFLLQRIERAAAATPYLFGERIGHSDIAVACVLRFTNEAHSHLFNAQAYPALTAHSTRCEALPAFKEIVQPLSPPKG